MPRSFPTLYESWGNPGVLPFDHPNGGRTPHKPLFPPPDPPRPPLVVPRSPAPARPKMSQPNRSSPDMATTAMSSSGSAKTTVDGKANQLAKFEEFLAHVAEHNDELAERWGSSWAEMPASELAQREVWAHFATYLVEIVRIAEGVRNAGKPLDIGTAHGIWTGAIHQARGRLSKAEPEIKARARSCCA